MAMGIYSASGVILDQNMPQGLLDRFPQSLPSQIGCDYSPKYNEQGVKKIGNETVNYKFNIMFGRGTIEEWPTFNF